MDWIPLPRKSHPLLPMSAHWTPPLPWTFLGTRSELVDHHDSFCPTKRRQQPADIGADKVSLNSPVWPWRNNSSGASSSEWTMEKNEASEYGLNLNTSAYSFSLKFKENRSQGLTFIETLPRHQAARLKLQSHHDVYTALNWLIQPQPPQWGGAWLVWHQRHRKNPKSRSLLSHVFN